MIDRPIAKGRNIGTIICPVGSASGIVAAAWLTVRCDGGGRAQAWFQKAADSDGPPPGAGAAMDQTFKHANVAWSGVPDGTRYIQYQVDANGPGAISVELQAK